MSSLLGLKETKTGKVADYYEVCGRLGQGSFGRVVRARHKVSGTERAIKILSKQRMKQKHVYWQLMQSELAVIKQLDHPNIVKLYEIFEDKHHVYIVNELMGEELLERMYRLKKCSEE